MGKVSDYVLGTVFTLIGPAVAVLVWTTSGDELRPLNNLQPLQPADITTLRTNQEVLIEAKLATDHPKRIDNLIAGCEQTYVRDDDGGSWENGEAFNQPLYVPFQQQRVALELNSPCPRGNYAKVQHSKGSSLRWVGYRNGDMITAVGRVAGQNPVSIRVQRHYAGTVADYRGMLGSVRFFGPLFGLVFSAAGIFVLYSTRKRYRSRPRKSQANAPVPDWVRQSQAEAKAQWEQPNNPPRKR